MDLAISPDIPKQSIIIPKWWKWKIKSHYNWQNKNFLYRKIIVWNRFRWIGGNFLNKSMSTGLWLCLERAVKSNVNTQSNTDHFWRTKWNKSLKANRKIKHHHWKFIDTISKSLIDPVCCEWICMATEHICERKKTQLTDLLLSKNGFAK